MWRRSLGDLAHVGVLKHAVIDRIQLDANKACMWTASSSDPRQMPRPGKKRPSVIESIDASRSMGITVCQPTEEGVELTLYIREIQYNGHTRSNWDIYNLIAASTHFVQIPKL